MNTDGSFNFPIRTSHEENALSLIYPNPLSIGSRDFISTPPGFRLSSVNGTSLDSPNGFQFEVIYPEDWKVKVKRFITFSNPYDPNDQNIISLFGQFKVTCFREWETIEVTTHLFDFDKNYSKLESLASIVSTLESVGDIVSRCHLVPGQNHNKFSIVKRIFNNKISTQNVNHCMRLSFFIIAQNGRLKLGETNCIEITSQMNQEPLAIGERVNSGEINLGAISPQINPEPLETGRFTLIPSTEFKTSFFSDGSRVHFSLTYPEDWGKKSYKIKFIEEDTWADQYDINNKRDVILSCQFKAIYKNKSGTVIEEKTADLLRLSDNKFEHLAKIEFRRSKKDVGHYSLIPIKLMPKSRLIQHILNRKITVHTINQVANLFFRVIAYHQGQIVDQTNWLEVSAKKNRDKFKNRTQRVKDIQEQSQNNLQNDTQIQPQLVSRISSGAFSEECSTESESESADIKNFTLNFLNPEQKNYLLSNCNIFFKLGYPNDWPKDYQLINEEDNQKENTISLIGRFKAISHTEGVEEECNLSSRRSDGKWKSLADMIPVSSDDQKIICFKLRPRTNCTKNVIVKKLLQDKIREKITPNIINCYSLFFYVVAFDGQRQIGQTNDIEMRTRTNQDNVKKKNRADKRSRKRKRVESQS